MVTPKTKITTNMLGRRVRFKAEITDVPNTTWAALALADAVGEVVAVQASDIGLVFTVSWDETGAFMDIYANHLRLVR